MAEPKPYYDDGTVTIYHGDAREWMPPCDVLLTDPPYGAGMNSEGIVLYDRPGATWPEPASYRTDVYTVGPTSRAARTGHPAEKPASVLRDLVARMTTPDSVVLDPFMGSGTTLVAAKDLGRRAIGIELDERWCEKAADRCRQGVLGLA